MLETVGWSASETTTCARAERERSRREAMSEKAAAVESSVRGMARGGREDGGRERERHWRAAGAGLTARGLREDWSRHRDVGGVRGEHRAWHAAELARARRRGAEGRGQRA